MTVNVAFASNQHPVVHTIAGELDTVTFCQTTDDDRRVQRVVMSFSKRRPPRTVRTIAISCFLVVV
jgi:hypothetical protein